MAYIGDMFIGGNSNENTIGIAWLMDKTSDLNETYESEHWEIEILKNSKYIVARTDLNLDYIVQKNEGLCKTNEFLDKLSVRKSNHYQIIKPTENYFMVYKEKQKLIFECKMTDRIKINTDFKIYSIDNNGNRIKKFEYLYPKWNSVFRFYRFSMLSTNKFDAYRNLFLSLENLLSIYKPKLEKESEIKWFRRALNFAYKEKIVGKSTSDRFVKDHYINIRCRLFHGKKDGFILPHSSDSFETINCVYDDLLMIWQKFVSKILDCNFINGGMTVDGISLICKSIYDKPVIKIDMNRNGSNEELITFNSTEILDDNKHYQSTIQGKLDVSLYTSKKCNRILVCNNDTLISELKINEGIDLSGVSIFKVSNTIEILNG